MPARGVQPEVQARKFTWRPACSAPFPAYLGGRSMSTNPTRRQFLAAASAGAALSLTATNYARVVGANERIALGLIGCG